MRQGPRGFTLLEMMIVVAIVGILSTLGVVSIVSMTRVGRVNAAAGTLTRALVDGRLRAMTQRCPHVVQINGPSYTTATPPAGAPMVKGSVAVIRKANCNPLTLNPFFEPGGSPDGSDRDRVITTTILGDDAIPTRGVRFHFAAPSGLVAGGDELETQAVAVTYDVTGARTVRVDSGSGFTGAGTAADLLLFVASPADNPDAGQGVQISVPAAGVASRQ